MAPVNKNHYYKRSMRAVLRRNRMKRHSRVGDVPAQPPRDLPPPRGPSPPPRAERRPEERATPGAEGGGGVGAPVASTPVAGRALFEFRPEDDAVSPVQPLRRAAALDQESAEPPPEKLTGRRLVRICELIAQIQSDRHPGGADCTFMDSVFVKETKRKGFESTLVYRCKVCNKVTELMTDPPVQGDGSMGVNHAMVLGALAGGGGNATLSELSGALDMPCMANSTYIQYERSLGNAIEQAALDSMLAAGREERRLAIEAGDLAPDGTPCVRVMGDAIWGKRSYKNKYNALSGTGFIIGWRTKKVLFYGVRNKHCFSCAIAARRGVEPGCIKRGNCAKNYTGPSTGMENSIMCEGFHASEAMHGVRFHQFVADGDASVHAKLIDTMPYGPIELVEKIECKNHLLRNLRNHLRDLGANARLPVPSETPPAQVKSIRQAINFQRQLIRKEFTRISIAVSSASNARAKEDGSLHDRTKRLRADILNAAAHVFGEHTWCDTYFCKVAQAAQGAAPSCPPPATPGPSSSTDQGENYVPRMMETGVWREVMRIMNAIANHAGSLIHNADTNKCEVVNGVTAKFLAGKRIFYSAANSFNIRAGAAALSLNTSGQFQRQVHKTLQEGDSPGLYTTKHTKTKKSRLQCARARRLEYDAAKRPAKRRAADGPDANYGLGVRQLEEDVDDVEDVAPESEQELKAKMDAVLAALTERLESMLLANNMEFDDLQGSPGWVRERLMRLTASFFKRVCTRREYTLCKNLVYEILYSNKRLPNHQHGHKNEPVARERLRTQYQIAVKTCGLFQDRELCFIAASPDGLIGDNELVEIKCPVNGEDYATPEAAVDGKHAISGYIMKEGDHLNIRRESDYYYQIQGQLHVTQRQKCLLYVYTKTWDIRVWVERDDNFWETQMRPFLVRFYMEALLPEIASPRYRITKDRQSIREPKYILDAIEAKDRKKRELAEAQEKRHKESKASKKQRKH